MLGCLFSSTVWGSHPCLLSSTRFWSCSTMPTPGTSSSSVSAPVVGLVSRISQFVNHTRKYIDLTLSILFIRAVIAKAVISSWRLFLWISRLGRAGIDMDWTHVSLCEACTYLFVPISSVNFSTVSWSPEKWPHSAKLG